MQTPQAAVFISERPSELASRRCLVEDKNGIQGECLLRGMWHFWRWEPQRQIIFSQRCQSQALWHHSDALLGPVCSDCLMLLVLCTTWSMNRAIRNHWDDRPQGLSSLLAEGISDSEAPQGAVLEGLSKKPTVSFMYCHQKVLPEN